MGYEIDVNGTCTAFYRDKQRKVAHSATSVHLGIVTSEKILFVITFLTAAESPKANTSVTANKVTGRKVTNLDLNNVREHFPIPTSSRRCARCNTKEKCKRTSIACEKCDAALCLACFAPFHKP
ncbi:hypothetical protein J6590_087113 [Homalodisca vitripennis]|nr:hypothetical protein J6590_087113 [Homalodisca vitripennis]